MHTYVEVYMSTRRHSGLKVSNHMLGTKLENVNHLASRARNLHKRRGRERLRENLLLYFPISKALNSSTYIVVMQGTRPHKQNRKDKMEYPNNHIPLFHYLHIF